MALVLSLAATALAALVVLVVLAVRGLSSLLGGESIDMGAIPGDTPAETITAMIADEAAIGMINKKTTAVRVIPAIGKKVGDMVEFGGLLGAAPIMPIKPGSPAKFINRGGRIPAPLHSLKN